MKTDGLQLQYLPPLRIPFRFFISAPLFGILSALLLLGSSAGGWPSRWAPEIMAATHLLTLGFMATVMLGALFQVLPVLSGHTIAGQRWLAPTVHLLISGGALDGECSPHRRIIQKTQLPAVSLGDCLTNSKAHSHSVGLGAVKSIEKMVFDIF